ncbi:MAG: TetM/TetW/TetO/TetS family tetracycline resistance ribosomal protection protein, partial [Actinomycetota bacterium]|nr:TetM/TetW/TetO/TetS family tetracycline resistance ribosomal protection protein [Actinomycetota bacterium]
VDQGSTQTDSLALERQRGITIKTAVVSFVVDGVTVNLIDTPGHPDFIAEVERVLNVLDGAVLVVSAVEGVQAQTRILMRTLQRLGVPTLIFVNKIDRAGATHDEVLREIAEKLSPSAVAMGAPHDLGTRQARFAPYDEGDSIFRAQLGELLAGHDERIMTAYVDGTALPDLPRELAAQVGRSLVHPVFFGSAITGAGVDSVMDGITSLLPAAEGDEAGGLSGAVFKIERGATGEKVAYVRVFSGCLRTRDRVRIRDDEQKVTAIRVFERGDAVQASSVGAGRIAKLWGLSEARIGDEIGVPRRPVEHHFDPPTLETVVVPRRASEKGALHAALAQLAEQDPLINLRQDDLRQELSVSLYGEVQKEVIEATLRNDYDLEVGFRETTMICVERPAGVGEAVEEIGKGNPFLATVGLRVEPATVGSGLMFTLDAPLETLPLYVYGSVDAFRSAIENVVRETLREGLHGWQVIDCAVTMTRSGYEPPGTGRRDFRYLTPLVLMDALQETGTNVCEPIHRFQLEIPSDSVGVVSQALARLEASPSTIEPQGSSSHLEGDIAAARLHELQQRLPALTRGEGVLASAFDHYRPIRRGEPPSRPRTGRDPRNREEYLRQVLRRF